MPNEFDCRYKEVDGKFIEEPLMVTIALGEYRSLVQENTRNSERIAYLENRLLEEIEKNGMRGADNG
jgi:hypothetical protein